MKTIKISREHFSSSQGRNWIKAVNCLSGFKSVNLIGTKRTEGSANLAIISSLFHLGANPPLMGFVLRPHSGESPRHTLLNIKERSFFTINHIHADILKKSHQTSARYPRDCSEFEACGLSEEYKDNFQAPFVQESRIQLAMELLNIVDVPENGTHIVIGQIKDIYLPEDTLKKDGFIDLQLAGSLCVSGLDAYYSPTLLERLSYAKPDKEVTPLTIDGEPIVTTS